MVSDVYQADSESPGIGGTNGSPPVAMTMLRVVISRPSTRTLQGDVTVASPETQCTPRPVYRSTESCGSIFAMMRCTRSMTSAKSNSTLALRKPYSGARAA